MANPMDEALFAALLASTVRVSTPLIFCALAGLLSERSGVVDAKRLDVLLCMAIEAMRHRQAETRGELRIPQTE